MYVSRGLIACIHTYMWVHTLTHIHTHARTDTSVIHNSQKVEVCGVSAPWSNTERKRQWSTDMCSSKGEAQKAITGEKSDTKGHVYWSPSTRVAVILERKGVSFGGTKNVLEVGNSEWLCADIQKPWDEHFERVNSMARELYLGLKIEFGKRYFTWTAFAGAARS